MWAGLTVNWLILLLALLPVAIGLGVAVPAANSMITRESPPNERGQILGISQSFAALARVVGPLLAGWSFRYQAWGPFVLAGAFVALASMLSLRLAPPSRPSEDPRFRKRDGVGEQATV